MLRNLVFSGVSLVLLTACGYSAVYNTSTRTEVSNVAIGKIAMRNVEQNVGERRVAQLVRQKLAGRLRGGESSPYRLNVSVDETLVTLAVRRDATAQRFQVSLSAQVNLFSQNEVKPVKSFILSASAPFNVEDSPFGTDSGKIHARESAARVLSEEILYRLTLFLNKQNEG